MFSEIKAKMNLENKENPEPMNSERMTQIQRMLVKKHRQLFYQNWDDDQAVIHNLNKKFMLQHLKPFNEKLTETRIQMVELYAWIRRISKVLKKTHVAIFKGINQKEDEYEIQGPYERKNQMIDQSIILELNVIGKREYDDIELFKSYIPDLPKRSQL